MNTPACTAGRANFIPMTVWFFFSPSVQLFTLSPWSPSLELIATFTDSFELFCNFNHPTPGKRNKGWMYQLWVPHWFVNAWYEYFVFTFLPTPTQKMSLCDHKGCPLVAIKKKAALRH